MAEQQNVTPPQFIYFSFTIFSGPDSGHFEMPISFLDGPTPVSKTSIQSLKIVERTEEEKPDEECTICLEKLFHKENKEAVVKETPCGHRYHGECIDKWFEIHVTCPLCRYNMPHEHREEEVPEVEIRFLEEDDYDNNDDEFDMSFLDEDDEELEIGWY